MGVKELLSHILDTYVFRASGGGDCREVYTRTVGVWHGSLFGGINNNSDNGFGACFQAVERL